MTSPGLPYALPPQIALGAIFRGDTVVFPIWTATVRGVPVEEGGEIIDLTGATIWFTAKRSLADADDDPPGFQQSTVAGGVQIIDPTLGQYQVTIDPASTVGLTEAGSFTCDVQVRTAGSLQTLTVLRGTLSVALDVTRTIA